MPYASINELSLLTGFSRRTVSKRLSEAGLASKGRKGSGYQFETTAAFPILYELEKLRSVNESYDLIEQRARLTFHRANCAQLKVDQSSGELISSDSVLQRWHALVTSVRAQLLSLPSKVAPLVVAEDRVTHVELIIRKAVYEALTELAGSGLSSDVERRKCVATLRMRNGTSQSPFRPRLSRQPIVPRPPCVRAASPHHCFARRWLRSTTSNG